MATPKAQTKIKYKKGKTEITYESNLDATEYYLYELTRAALRDVGKFLCNKFKEGYYAHFKRITGKGGRVTKYKVFSGAKTTAPRVQIGLPHAHKNFEVEGFYAYFQEFGARGGAVPRLGLLTKAAEENVAEIIKIESQYLSGLSGEAARLEALVNESDYEGGAD